MPYYRATLYEGPEILIDAAVPYHTIVGAACTMTAAATDATGTPFHGGLDGHSPTMLEKVKSYQSPRST